MAKIMIVMAYEYAEVVDVVDDTLVWEVVEQLQDMGYFRIAYPDIYEDGIPVNRAMPMKKGSNYFFRGLKVQERQDYGGMKT